LVFFNQRRESSVQISFSSEDLGRLTKADRKILLGLVERLKVEAPAQSARGAVESRNPKVRQLKKKTSARLSSMSSEEAADIIGSVNERAQAVLKLISSKGHAFDWKFVVGRFPDYTPHRFVAAVHRRFGTLNNGKYRPLARIEADGARTVVHESPETVASLRQAFAT
jgi:hypothetical protein